MLDAFGVHSTCAAASSGKQSQPPLASGSSREQTTVKIADDVSISLPQPWKRSGVTFTNATELVRLASNDERRQIGRIIVYAELRTDHKEAVRRLADITAGPKNAGLEFFTASGWPAVERWYLAPLPVRGRQRAGRENEPITLTRSDEPALWLTLAIAYRDLVIRLEATFMPDADPRIAKEVRSAGFRLSSAKTFQDRQSKSLTGFTGHNWIEWLTHVLIL